MQWKIPKNTDKYYWTQHVVGKMHHYGLSEQKVLGVIRRPKRIETGIAPDTVAVMQPAGTIKYDSENKKELWKQEIWVMYQLRDSGANSKNQMTNSKQILNDKKSKLQKLQDAISSNKKLTIISAWRFPGVSSEKDPIPAEIWREIEELQITR